MNKRCPSCSIRFLVDENELQFYEKVQLPPPSHCRDCRVQRRMAWRNDRTFSVRKSDFSGKQMVSIYPPSTPFPVFHPSEWYGDLWDPMDHGRTIDFSRPFFPQWHELMKSVPRLGVDIVNCENSDYCNYCGDDKNCYLDIAGEGNQECFYNLFTKYSRDCVDCTFAYNSELCYEAINCYRCYNICYSMYVEDSRDCAFCFDLKSCSDCLFCSNIRHAQYQIFNTQYSKEEYFKRRAGYELHTHSGVARAKEIWSTDVLSKAIHRDMYSLNSENCTGNDIKSSKNCQHVFNVTNCEDCRYLYDVLDAKDCFDLNYSLYKPEASCELISTLGMKYSAFNMASHYCSEVYYCDLCNNSSHLFGCIGLNRKEHCILNTQYSKSEYEELKGKLIAHMKETKEWGEFFPASLSPFGYNETVAQEYFPLEEREALNRGFSWFERGERGLYDGPKTSLPDSIDDADDSVYRNVYHCTKTNKPYKIILPELRFYQKMKLPLPRVAPDQRHRDRLSTRNMRNLWESTCDNCGNEITTSYSPQTPYKIFCETCYLKRIES